MEFTQTGIILKTEKYNHCVRFYSEILGLCLVSEKIEGEFRMSEFNFGGSYLLIETGGKASLEEKSSTENPTVLRFDIPDANIAIAYLQNHGVQTAYYTYDWANIIIIIDPDGNRIELKETK
ncbi:hypothetical protein ABT56_07120 [Photobacterium aquae]|uniref:VOC domain-containing protein n=1 Tax=Photobacterium aquae TaxID=1195763 RepID=A0A0J1H564_9GAMM|nr:glyoxalase/bleomycin resistance/dioxygenase family protein [Photobacterium aquae]KLV06919.1 hypothetical protein ABT56_07120 [Photobacterium aquae]